MSNRDPDMPADADGTAGDGWEANVENRYRFLVEEAEDMLYMLDPAGRYRLVNDSMVDVTGYDREDLIGETPDVLLSEEDIEAGEARIRRLLGSDERTSDTWTVTLHTSDGSEVPAELRFTLLPAADGETYGGIVGVARDVRERKRREQKLQVMTRILRHNIRNKLGLVMGKAELLRKEVKRGSIEASPEAEVIETSLDIEETAAEMVRLSEKARTIQERVRPQPEQDLRTDVATLAGVVVRQYRKDNPSAAITLEAPETVYARVSESYEVALAELVENGIVHARDDEPRIDIALSREGDTVVTTVTDRCPRIPESEIRVIREERETDLSHSAGVGLWLVYWVVEAIGGEVTFDYEGDGNRIELRFEAADAG